MVAIFTAPEYPRMRNCVMTITVYTTEWDHICRYGEVSEAPVLNSHNLTRHVIAALEKR